MPQRKQHQNSVNRILSASLEAIRSVGAAGFSTPVVAQMAKVRQSHVTYYFPTRKELLLATTNFALQRYEKEFETRLNGLEKFNLKTSITFLDWLFTDAISDLAVRTFPELWSLANTDSDIAKAVQELYVNAARLVVKALGLDPDKKKSHKLLELLLLIGSVSEGITAMHGHRKKTDAIFLEHKDHAIKIFAPMLLHEYKIASRSSTSRHTKSLKKGL